MQVSGSNLYYIYLDTKIIGALEQLIGYFQTQVFDSNKCIEVVCKYYKEIADTFQRVFIKHNIPFRFVRKQSDYKLDKGKVVLYLFNAQSNCKLVANRDLVHIFVTHGESHKLASIKPIIRIYDYVVTSGNVGIDRFLKSGVFTPYDVQSGRIITLGDTFLGNNEFHYNFNSNALVYAPTWEGGVPEENYCSLQDVNIKKIINFCKREVIKCVYIKPHPNLGHRDKDYISQLNLAIKTFRENGIVVFVCTSKNKKFNIFKFLLTAKNGCVKKINDWGAVKFAITDISAMEMQFIRKKIPCLTLIDSKYANELYIPKRLDTYVSKTFFDINDCLSYDSDLEKIRDELFDYFITYPSEDIARMSYSNRIQWLCQHTTRLMHKRNKFLKENY
ncbi:hypothetical protein RCM62_17260 [Escherichia marmotae]|nr:hypothetical protein [Escherichia marmotae]MEC9844809.1 hypothetical protein [Escherichia marmotae]MED9123595.1 hypothetical protein [Escherichia marmotae]